ncbi:MAG: methyltransferase domain-containing protein [Polyangiaceae bacterium]|nr:methyltransferase domain-containing protein [Polyangiaceae bacterium]
MASEERRHWAANSFEAAVERFYEAGIGADEDWHGGYRNFGWWEGDNRDYLRAADALVGQVNRLLCLSSTSRLLDVACGGATQDIYLHRLTGAEIDGVDATWAQVKEGRKRIAAAGIVDKVRLHHGTATDLSAFAPESFSHVTCIEGGPHFDTRELFLQQAFSRLRSGGIIVLADLLVLSPARLPWERFALKRAQRMWNVPDANVLDRDGFRASLERVGFTQITMEEVGRHIMPGYYRDQCSAETVDAQRRFKGRMWRLRHAFANFFLFKSWQLGVIEYVLVRAVKPRASATEP